MKTLIVSFAIWIFVVPAAVAVFLIYTTVAVRTPDLYFSVIALALALSILAMVSGPSLGLNRSSRPAFGYFQKVSNTQIQSRR
jgi:hypothetical protein